jgi:hypothetical protein
MIKGLGSSTALSDRIKERSEHQVGRVKYCKSCGRVHMFPRYQARQKPSVDGPGLGELALGVAVLIVWMVALFWALPILMSAGS